MTSPANVAIVGFLSAGCVPFHLRALLASGRPFVFFGARQLYERAMSELPHPVDIQVHFENGSKNSTAEFQWLEETLAAHSEIQTVYFMEIEHFRGEIIQAKWTGKYPELRRRRLRGNLFPRPCFYYRPSFAEKMAFWKWQAWSLMARVSLEPQGLLVIDAHYPALFPLLRVLPSGLRLVRECPEPYDRLLVPDTVSVESDAQPPSILLFGHHTRRKGTAWALEALAKFPIPLRVIVAGQCEEEALIRQLGASLPPHVAFELLAERISDQTKETLFKRASVILLPYEVFLGSSGLIFEAMLYRRKVLASHVCVVDERLRQSRAVTLHRLGDAEDFRLRLAESLAATPTWPAVDSFLAQHGVQQFAEAVLPTTPES
jgi:glycosyltransferase involved in cell wall biosynthesis